MGHYDDDYAWTAEAKLQKSYNATFQIVRKQIKALDTCLKVLEESHDNIDAFHYRVLKDLYNDLKAQDAELAGKIKRHK